MPILRINNITREYIIEKEIIHALHNVTFDIYEGEILVITGPSGSGKSTLLNLLTSIDRPTSGSILYGNTDIALSHEKKLTAYRQYVIGLMFQENNLIEEASIDYNVTLARKLSGGESTSLSLDEKNILSDLYIDSLPQIPVYKLSNGEQQRVSIARILINNPKIIFADEPTGCLDSNNAGRIIEMLRSIALEKNKTLIIVSHNPEITKIGDRVLYLKDGQIEKIDIQKERNNTTQNEYILEKRKKIHIKDKFTLSFQSFIRNFKKYLSLSISIGFGLSVILALFFLMNSFSSTILDPSFYNYVIVKPETNLLSPSKTKSILNTEDITKINALASGEKHYTTSSFSGTITYKTITAPFFATTASPVNQYQTSFEKVMTGNFFSNDSSNEEGILVTPSELSVLHLPNNQSTIGKMISISVLFNEQAKKEQNRHISLPIIGILDPSDILTGNLVASNFANLYSLPTQSYTSEVLLASDQSHANAIAKTLQKANYDTTQLYQQFDALNQEANINAPLNYILAGIGLFLSIITLIISVIIIFSEKEREIALMKALGGATLQIFQLHFLEGIYTGILIAIPTSLFLFIEITIINTVITSNIIPQISIKNASIIPFGFLQIFIILFIAILLGCISILIPSLKGSRVIITKALHRLYF